ncbi:MAG: DUF5606 domain-containing protein [Saprospiraceae bacterium]|nr:DUF5606 domain-containing protein [Saprospiraceae bacterium]
MSVQFDDLVAVSGMSGLFKMVANRPNGLIIEELDTGKKKLAPSRKHQFTPLASIGIYTGPKDTTELAEVFRTMREQLETNPPVDPSKASGTELAAYFIKILPDYDPDRVFAGDIKKVIKWFSFLNERDLIPEKEEESKEETNEEEASEKETTEEATEKVD